MKKSMIARREAIRPQLDAYVDRSLLPALGLPGVPFELTVPSEGTRSLVFFVKTAGRRFVLKSFFDVGRALRTLVAARHMVAAGAPVPRLLHADFSLRTRVRTGLVHLVEQAIDGANLYEVELTADRVAQAARALATLHNITRPRWGALLPVVGRRRGYFDFVNARLQRRLKGLVVSQPALAGFEVVREWFVGFRGRAEVQPHFNLCHLRISSTNILFAADGNAYLIDLVTARYGVFAIDLERALHRWCDDDPALCEAFLQAYFAATTHTTRADWEARRAYFHGSFHLAQAYRAGKSLCAHLRLRGETGPRKRSRLRNRVIRHLEGLLQVMAADAGARLDPAVINHLRGVLSAF